MRRRVSRIRHSPSWDLCNVIKNNEDEIRAHSAGWEHTSHIMKPIWQFISCLLNSTWVVALSLSPSQHKVSFGWKFCWFIWRPHQHIMPHESGTLQFFFWCCLHTGSSREKKETSELPTRTTRWEMSESWWCVGWGWAKPRVFLWLFTIAP